MAERRHLVIYLSGAHAYGFPSPDSDLDLKCVHIAPTADLVGLALVGDPPDRIEIVEGVELDYGSNELAPVLRGA
ncbi:MAG: nucleotidyltransferase domain-containing protein, partial [Kofleriaceae bacterium]